MKIEDWGLFHTPSQSRRAAFWKGFCDGVLIAAATAVIVWVVALVFI